MKKRDYPIHEVVLTRINMIIGTIPTRLINPDIYQRTSEKRNPIERKITTYGRLRSNLISVS